MNQTGLKEERRLTMTARQRKGTLDSGISISSSNKSVEEMRIHEKACAERISSMEAQVNQLRGENDKLLTRLSEIAAVRLTDNNPNITDLSDANRPEKLMEQFSEIYDNEWTDAFECLTGTKASQEYNAVKELLSILQVIYEQCLSLTREQSKRLKEAIVLYLGMSTELKDSLVIKETLKRLREYRVNNVDLGITHIGQIINKQLKGQLEDKVYVAADKYIQACTRVCWLMCINDPGMHLNFGESPRNDESRGDNDGADNPVYFNATEFVSYTKTGKYVEFVVWPAVYLYKDGPIMKKGVAQGSQGKKTKKTENVDYRNGSDYNKGSKTIGEKYHMHNGPAKDSVYTETKDHKADNLSNYSTCGNILNNKAKAPTGTSKIGVSVHTKVGSVMTKQKPRSSLPDVISSVSNDAFAVEGTDEKLGTEKEGNASSHIEERDFTKNVVLNSDQKTDEFKSGDESKENIKGKSKKKKKKNLFDSLKGKSSN